MPKKKRGDKKRPVVAKIHMRKRGVGFRGRPSKGGRRSGCIFRGKGKGSRRVPSGGRVRVPRTVGRGRGEGESLPTRQRGGRKGKGECGLAQKIFRWRRADHDGKKKGERAASDRDLTGRGAEGRAARLIAAPDPGKKKKRGPLYSLRGEREGGVTACMKSAMTSRLAPTREKGGKRESFIPSHLDGGEMEGRGGKTGSNGAISLSGCPNRQKKKEEEEQKKKKKKKKKRRRDGFFASLKPDRRKKGREKNFDILSWHRGGGRGRKRERVAMIERRGATFCIALKAEKKVRARKRRSA